MSTKLKKDLIKAKKNKPDTKLIAVRLPLDVVNKINSIAKETKQSVSQVIIFALRESLK